MGTGKEEEGVNNAGISCKDSVDKKRLRKDRVKYLRSIGIQAAYIGESKTKDAEILNEEGALSLLFGSPESLTGDRKFREMFSKKFYQENTVAVVCDEVHTAVHWGESTDNKDPFRKWCGRVGEIRSLLPQGDPMLALTATGTAATRKRIKNLLSFKQGVEIIVSPNRKNVKLVIKKVTSDIACNFSWLVKEVSRKGVECARTLIYVKDYQTCGELYNFFMNSLQDKAYWPTNSPKKSTRGSAIHRVTS
ncbi:putative ATP-dependent DNA helicase Q1 [Montipora capricornis]|uniref:putative ATP-dependent DNA helicase Q1 n=1 Tax=Montipora capricornis TaxID=246305 RepID=UPI0035F18A5C